MRVSDLNVAVVVPPTSGERDHVVHMEVVHGDLLSADPADAFVSLEDHSAINVFVEDLLLTTFVSTGPFDVLALVLLVVPTLVGTTLIPMSVFVLQLLAMNRAVIVRITSTLGLSKTLAITIAIRLLVCATTVLALPIEPVSPTTTAREELD